MRMLPCALLALALLAGAASSTTFPPPPGPVTAPDDEDPPEEEIDEEEDDEAESPSDCDDDEGGDSEGDDTSTGNSEATVSSGDGVFLNVVTGEAWLEVPVLKTYAAGAVEFDLQFRYESTNRRNRGFGRGWSHSLDMHVLFSGEAIIYIDEQGRRNKFNAVQVGELWQAPPGRAGQIFWNPEESTFRLDKPNGDRIYFPSLPGAPPLRIEHPNGATTTFAHNGSSTTITSAYGRTITLDYDTQDQVQITGPDSETTTLYLNANNELAEIRDPLGHSIYYEYDPDTASDGRMVKEILRNGHFYTVEYEEVGDDEVHKIKDANDDVIVKVTSPDFPDFEFHQILKGTVQFVNGREEVITCKRDAVARIESIEYPAYYDDLPGGPTQNLQGTPMLIGPRKKEFVWGPPSSGNNRNRLVSKIDFLDRERTNEWDEYGNLILHIDEAGNETTYEYWDGHTLIKDRVWRKTSPDGDVWEYDYDSSGRVTKIIYPSANFPPTAEVVEEWSHTYYPTGAPGRLKSTLHTDRNGNTHLTEYDEDGSLLRITRAEGPLNLVTEFVCDAMGRPTRVTEKRSGTEDVVTEIEYDAMARKRFVRRDPAGLNLTTEYIYDAHGNLIDLVDPKGNITHFEYDHRNRLRKEVRSKNELNITTEWELDGEGNVTERRDPNGNVYRFWYTPKNDVKRIQDPEGNDTYIHRDAEGNPTWITRVTETRLIETALEYDDLDRLTARIEAPHTLALRTEYEYADPAGCSCQPSLQASLVRKLTDPEGEVTYFRYDYLDRLTEIIRKNGDIAEDPDSNDAVTSFTYDDAGNRKSVVGPEGETTLFEYDEAHRLKESRRVSASGDLVTTYTHDGSDNLASVTNPQGNVEYYEYDAVNRLQRVYDGISDRRAYTYDENGNVETLTTGLTNQTWSYNYDELDRLISVVSPETGPSSPRLYGYDAASNLIEMVAPSGTVTKYFYDGLRRMTSRVDNFVPPPVLQTPYPNAINNTTRWIYDELSLVGYEDDPGNQTTYEYDEVLRLVTRTHPDGLGSKSWTYHPDGQVHTRTDENGVVTTYVYNDLDQLTARTYPGRSESFTFDLSGRPTLGSSSEVHTTLGYDDLGRLELERYYFVDDQASYQTTRSYSADPGLPTVTTYPSGSGFAVTHTFDDRLRLANVSAGSTLSKAFTYDVVDRLDGAIYANGVASQLLWDLNNRIERITHSPTAGGALFDVEYGYDEDDYRIWSQDHVRPDHSELVVYDEVDRVRRVDRGVLNGSRTAITQALDSPVLPSIENWVRLDRRGNWKRIRTGYGTDPTVREDREVNAVNEYQTIDPDGPAPGGPAPELPLAADANGNLRENPLAATGGVSGHEYAYDDENRLTTVSELGGGPLLDVFYDAFGTRVESVDHTGSTSDCSGAVTTTRHISFDGATVEEYQACGVGAGLSFTLAREFVWGASFIDPVAMVDHTDLGDVAAGTAEILHYVTDTLGSVVALTDAASDLVERYDYSTYGKTFVSDASGVDLDASAFGNPIGWTGQRYDPGVGLYHFLHRSFSTHLGRWMQRDPLEFVDGPNMRQYVWSSPLAYVDPEGSIAFAIPLVAIAIGSAIESAAATAAVVSAAVVTAGAIIAGSELLDGGESTAGGESTSPRQRFGAGDQRLPPGAISCTSGAPPTHAVPPASAFPPLISEQVEPGETATGSDSAPTGEGRKESKVERSTTTTPIGDGRFTKTTEVRPGKDPGQSRTEYTRIKNGNGETIRTYKDSYDRGNQFQHRKPLTGGPEGRPAGG